MKIDFIPIINQKDTDTAPAKAEHRNPELCPACGNNDFLWGNIMQRGLLLDFRIKVGFFRKKSQKIYGRQCKYCGNIQMFAERFDEKEE